MVQKAVRSEASSPNSLGPKRDWPEVRGEEYRPRTVLSWLLAKWVVGESEEAGRRTLSSHGPENPEEKEIAFSLKSGVPLALGPAAEQKQVMVSRRAQLLHQPRVGTTLVHLFERLGLVNLQDSHGVQGGGCLARSTVSFGRESGCQLTGLGRETWTVPPSGGVSWAQVHRDRSLHLGNARVPPGHSAVEGSEDGGGGRAGFWP